MTRLCLGCMEQYETEYDICPHCGYVMGTEAEESIHMAPGTILEGRYVIGKVLGYGGFGVTYIAWDQKLEQKVAIKEYFPSEFATRMPSESRVTIFGGDKQEQFEEGLEKFIEEGKRLSKFQNEAGIVKIFDGFKCNCTAYLVMEYLEGETLASYLEREGKVTEEQMIDMLFPVMQSLQVVHNKGILHRDIAPENIFLTKDGSAKLIDFGASRYATTSHSRSLTVIIKPGYSPEEQYRSRGDQGPHTDLYALAAVMYKMMTGITPPDALERRAMIETKKKDVLKDIHKVQKDISPQVENAILNAMNVQIEDRTPTLTAFMDEMYSKEPVKRRYGKIKKLDVYAWPTWLKITLGSTLAAVVLTGILLVSGVIDFPSLFSGKVLEQEGMVQVPNLEGMGTEEAIAAIEKLGLQALASGNVESSYIEAGKIVLQKPAASEYIQQGGTVRLTVSSGGQVVGPVNGIATMPYVVWATQADAIATLGKAGLTSVTIEQAYDNNVEAGKVISQSVKQNEKIAVETQITLVISKGAAAIVPNVVGDTREQAAEKFKNAGLGTPIIEKQYSDTVKSGTIIAQKVNENEEVPKGTRITLIVSMGVKCNLNYAIGNGEVIITEQPTSLSGHVVIPEEIELLPVTSITISAFEGCESITSIELPSGVTSIGDDAFSGCSALTSINIPSGVTSIKPNTFAYCSSLTSIDIPDSITYIGWDTFRGCSSLTSITIPSGVTSIGESTFEGCSSLTSITIPKGVTSIGVQAFNGCSSLTSITIPNGVTSIGESTFEGCSSLESINIPSGVTSIGKCAFEGCSSLTSINIPSGVTSIGESTFEGCSALKSIELPSGVTSIGESTFEGCDALTSIKLPSGLTSIGDYAFRRCSSLTSIDIPDGVTSIGDYAFRRCSSLTSINIPSGVTSISNFAFEYCSALTSINIPSGVTRIGSSAFEGCSSLTSIELPSGVTSIGDFAFAYCGALTSINIPNGVTSIEYAAFEGCRSLTSIELPSGLTSIKMWAFDGCSELTSIELPSSLTSIGDEAFKGCSSLKSITIPSGVTSIGKCAFEGCSSLTSINIPSGVTSIGESTFEGCSALKSIELPSGVTSIGDSAFYYCRSLTSIELPSSLASIGDEAFLACYNLQTVYFATEAQKQQFASCFDSDVQLIVKE